MCRRVDERAPGAVTPKSPLPSDDELESEHRELLAGLPQLNVFRMIAGAPRAVRPFLELGGAVLCTALDARRREIAVLRVAHAPNAHYERVPHEQLARSAGVTEAEIDAIAAGELVSSLDEECTLIRRVADEVSREVRLSDGALEQIIGGHGPREATGLILLVSYYNIVSRFLESSRVQLEDEPSRASQTASSAVQRPRDRPRADVPAGKLLQHRLVPSCRAVLGGGGVPGLHGATDVTSTDPTGGASAWTRTTIDHGNVLVTSRARRSRCA